MQTLVHETNLPLPKKQGKVRDIYDLGDKLLIVTTDRISAFDVILPNAIPRKGEVLTKLSAFWLSQIDVPHHLITTDIHEMVAETSNKDGIPEILLKNEEVLKDRSMLVTKHKPLPVECIVRGYLCGSAYKEYKQTGHVCGIKLPSGLKENSPLPEPIFTPSTKADKGHDENISLDQMIDLLGGTGVDQQLCEDVVEDSIEVYKDAAIIAFNNGIIIADTKFEWSYSKKDYNPILIDEVLTPDSSRFWAIENYQLDAPIESYDKQFVRDYLTNVGWDKTSNPPSLPSEVIQNTTTRYLKAYQALTGKSL
jgi:phosphoribosylaminoimidazole-succinocarboxamide synthase